MEQLTIIRTDTGKSEQVDYGARIRTIMKDQEKDGFPLIAARVNNEISSLAARLLVNSNVEPIYLNEYDGMRVYRRSLCFLLEIAVRDVLPHKHLHISHSLGHALYYNFEDAAEITSSELDTLSDRMRALVQEDRLIIPRQLSYADALKEAEDSEYSDTRLLLDHLNKNMILFNECGHYRALAHTPLAPRTGILGNFELRKYQDGFLLRYPPSGDPLSIKPFEDIPKLFQVYNDHKNWGHVLEVDCIGRLNSLAANKNDIAHFINVAETLHNQKISQIAESIKQRKGQVRVVLVAGPSSSGKTTFTKKLSVALQVVGFKPTMISLDDYYLPHDEVPRDEDGKPDFEALEALDVELLNQNLLDLFKGAETEFPIFDFKKGGRLEKGRKLQLDDNGILLMEGIHGLNDSLTPKIPANKKFKIYISALTQLNLDDLNRVSTTDNRIIRRMVRDHQFRGYPALNTLQMWPSVHRGERKNIFPFQNTADAMFNSALDYELAVLKVFAEPLLRSVKPTEREYSEACRLLRFLNNFTALPSELIPAHSILREFIGGSGFKY